MKFLFVALAACALAGCASHADPYYGYGHPSASIGVYPSHPGAYPVYHDGRYHRGRRDRDGDGIPNRVDADRDNDGVPNRHDARPNNPRRY